MALRVLLADESTTIKKVMQLALQDYGIEVKAVAIGLDVVSVAKSFKPDIFFVDVLLQKRSGYDVVKDLKANFAGIPVVLMWSGFMELDEAKAAACGADRRLEKPFDAEALRHLVKELVPKTAGNVISDYLTFPALPDFEEEPKLELPAEAAPATEAAVADPTATAGEPVTGADIYSIPEIGENEIPAEMPFGGAGGGRPAAAMAASPAGEESWSHQDLSKFKVDLSGDPAVDADVDDFAVARIQSEGEFEEVTFTSKKTAPSAVAPSAGHPVPAAPAPRAAGSPASAMDEIMAEKVLREEARAILERVVWQMLPDIAERVVREEIQKLLKDSER